MRSRSGCVGIDFCDDDPKLVVFIRFHCETQIGTVVVSELRIDRWAMIVLVNRQIFRGNQLNHDCIVVAGDSSVIFVERRQAEASIALDLSASRMQAIV